MFNYRIYSLIRRVFFLKLSLLWALSTTCVIAIAARRLEPSFNLVGEIIDLQHAIRISRQDANPQVTSCSSPSSRWLKGTSPSWEGGAVVSHCDTCVRMWHHRDLKLTAGQVSCHYSSVLTLTVDTCHSFSIFTRCYKIMGPNSA